MHQPDRPPRLTETLAAINKFMGVSELSPPFYEKHWEAIELATTFLKILVNNYPVVERPFRNALPLSLADGAIHMEDALLDADLDEEKMRWFDAQSTAVLRVLVPVVQDTELPAWLGECKWAIEGAFLPT